MALLAAAALLSAGCGPGSSSSSRHLKVVAAENVWGSVAGLLGGPHVTVSSLITDANANPHNRRPTAADVQRIAEADYVILNGAGYDDWAGRLVNANPSDSRRVLTIAGLLGKMTGDNPHFWYDPAYVDRVADEITAEYKRLDAADAADFRTLRSQVAGELAANQALIASIATSVQGRKVAATESFAAPMVRALHLRLISSEDFMQAVSDGSDPPADTVPSFEGQLARHEPAVLIYNKQEVTATTAHLRQVAQSAGIPILDLAETLDPPGVTFPVWQAAQLEAVRGALSGGALNGGAHT